MILLLGGTHEGREIAEILNALGHPYVLSVTTPLGYDLYHQIAKKCIINKFTIATLNAYIQSEGIHLIIDATHPHAEIIKSTARICARECNITYWRFERKQELVPQSNASISQYASVSLAIASLKETVEQDQKILITGTKHIPEFLANFDKSQCVFRIMPGEASMTICMENDVPIENIIAIKAPCSVEMNQCIFRDFNISYFVFKNSGRGSAFKSNVASINGTNVKGVVIEPKTITVDTRFNHLNALEKALMLYKP